MKPFQSWKRFENFFRLCIKAIIQIYFESSLSAEAGFNYSKFSLSWKLNFQNKITKQFPSGKATRSLSSCGSSSLFLVMASGLNEKEIDILRKIRNWSSEIGSKECRSTHVNAVMILFMTRFLSCFGRHSKGALLMEKKLDSNFLCLLQ